MIVRVVECGGDGGCAVIVRWGICDEKFGLCYTLSIYIIVLFVCQFGFFYVVFYGSQTLSILYIKL